LRRKRLTRQRAKGKAKYGNVSCSIAIGLQYSTYNLHISIVSRVYATHFWRLKVAIWEECNNANKFAPIFMLNMAKGYLVNVEQDLQIKILIFSISRNIDSKIWNNRVQSGSPTSAGADKAWPNSLRGVFIMYLKGWHSPKQARPVSKKKIAQIWNIAQPPPPPKMKMQNLDYFHLQGQKPLYKAGWRRQLCFADTVGLILLWAIILLGAYSAIFGSCDLYENVPNLLDTIWQYNELVEMSVQKYSIASYCKAQKVMESNSN
jgi:hypothetical protein